MGSGQSVDYNPSFDIVSTEFSLEERKAPPSHLVTKIKSFSKLSKLGISKLESAEFEAGDYKWKVIIYPDGDEEGKKTNHISVHLSMVGTSSLPAGWDVNASFNFFIYNHIKDNYLCFRGTAQRFHNINSEIRFSKLFATKILTDGYVLDDNCEFGAEVFVGGNGDVVDRVSLVDLRDPYGEWLDFGIFKKDENIWSSREFNAGGYNWKVELHPIATPTSRFRHYSIYLRCTDAESFGARTKVRATCKFTYKSIIHGKNHSNRASVWFTSSVQTLCLLGMAITDVFTSSKDAAANAIGHCTLRVQIFVEAIQEAVNESE